jgi:hypothetical protein
MSYTLSEVPLISDAYSHKNDKANNRVICSSSGEIKILNCDPDVLNEVLQNTNGKLTFGEIEDVFAKRFSIHEVRNFLNVLLEEGVIEKSATTHKVKKRPLILIIGEGIISDAFENCERITCVDFLKDDFNHDFDVAIFAPSVCTYSNMIKLNG